MSRDCRQCTHLTFGTSGLQDGPLFDLICCEEEVFPDTITIFYDTKPTREIRFEVVFHTAEVCGEFELRGESNE